MKKHYFIGIYDYTVILTYISLLISVLGIILALNDRIYSSLLCLMVSGICDMFDGTIARTKERTNEEKAFGIQIDSLCDLVCFGILPSIIIYRQAGFNIISATAVCVYILCALIRLAYFNVHAYMKMSMGEECCKFTGLPITSAALIFPIVIMVEHISFILNGFLPVMVMLLTGVLFVSPFEINKPQLKGKIAIVFIGIFEFIFMVVIKV